MTPDHKAALAIDTAAELARYREMFKQQFADMRRQTAEMFDEKDREYPPGPAAPASELDRLMDRAAFEASREFYGSSPRRATQRPAGRANGRNRHPSFRGMACGNTERPGHRAQATNY
jgi:hypothetical protein